MTGHQSIEVSIVADNIRPAAGEGYLPVREDRRVVSLDDRGDAPSDARAVHFGSGRVW